MPGNQEKDRAYTKGVADNRIYNPPGPSKIQKERTCIKYIGKQRIKHGGPDYGPVLLQSEDIDHEGHHIGPSGKSNTRNDVKINPKSPRAILVRMNHRSKSLCKTYDKDKYDENSIRWAVDFVDNLLYLKWQDAVKDLAARCELVLVVGSANSSNSNRLSELAQRLGSTAYLIDGAAHIKRDWLSSLTDDAVIGVTAGASAPDVLVREVIEHLQVLTSATIQESDGQVENVVFSLPKDLQVSS